MSVGEGPNYVHLKTGFLRKTAVLGWAILLIIGGGVWQMFFGVLFLLWLCNNNMDSDPGGSILNVRWRGAKLCLFKNGIFAKTSSFEFGNSADIWRWSLANVF